MCDILIEISNYSIFCLRLKSEILPFKIPYEKLVKICVMAMSTTYSLPTLQSLALHTQCLAESPSLHPTRESIYSILKNVGWIQIDTLQMIQCSQYIAMWSRIGCYDVTDFDSIIYTDEIVPANNSRLAFEYWMHAACIIPLAEFRYCMPMMRKYRDHIIGGQNSKNWAKNPENKKILQTVMRSIRATGGKRSSDFANPDQKRGSWWDWKPSKRALERLYNTGDLVISNRIKFQREYDLPSRVIPSDVNQEMPTVAEAILHLLEISMKALGVCRPVQVGDYFHMKRTQSRSYIEELIRKGIFLEIEGRLTDGNVHNLLIHKDNRVLLEKIADEAITPSHTTFLSPFDSLFWAKRRDQEMWSFNQVLEAYKPVSLRKWGYFCLPILYKGTLIGRFDPRLDRKSKQLHLRSLHLEPGIDLDDDLLCSVATAMKDFMDFHDSDELRISNSTSKEFAKKLLKAI